MDECETRWRCERCSAIKRGPVLQLRWRFPPFLNFVRSKKIKKNVADGQLTDVMLSHFGSRTSPIRDEYHEFIQVNTGAVHFHRAGDTQAVFILRVLHVRASGQTTTPT